MKTVNFIFHGLFVLLWFYLCLAVGIATMALWPLAGWVIMSMLDSHEIVVWIIGFAGLILGIFSLMLMPGAVVMASTGVYKLGVKIEGFIWCR